MAQLSRGYTFHDGGTGNSANLHALVDAGTILPGVIGEQASAAPADADSLLLRQAATAALKKCTVADIKATIPANAAANVASLRKLGTTALMAAAGNDARFPSRITGIRMANGTAPDTVATPTDLRFVSKQIPTTGASAWVIDWDESEIFYDSLTANRTYTFANVRDGRTITMIFKKNGHTVTLPAINTVTVGTGTTYLQVVLTRSQVGGGAFTGLQIAI